MDGDGAQESVNLRYYWHIILERRWAVIVAFVMVVLLCVVYLLKAPRIYDATVRIQIDRENENVLNLKDAFSLDSRGEQDYLQTQYKNLMSRTLIKSVFDKLNLKADDRYKQKMDPVRALASDISVIPIRLSRLVDVSVQHTNPEKAAQIANELASKFIENNIDRKRAASAKGGDWLKQEAASQKNKLEEAEKELQKYKEQLNNVSLEESQNIVLQALKLAQEQLVLAQSKSAILQKQDQEIQAMIKSGTPLGSIPQVRRDTLIQQLTGNLATQEAELANLLRRYKDKYPSVMQMRDAIASLKQSIRNAEQNIISTISSEAQIAKGEEESVQEYVRRLEKRQIDLGKDSIKYEQLKRDADLRKELYLTVLKNQNQTEVTTSSKINNMSVVDPAEIPMKPVKPRIILTLVLGLLGGSAAGFGLAYFINYLDDSIKTQDDVERFLQQTFLGYIPNIKSNSAVERDLHAHLHPQSTAAEGFRTVRASIALMPKAEDYRMLAVTSTTPSEGKSLLSCNLAIVTAQIGFKTLLVDADLRRPSIHKSFQLHSPVGLSAYLLEKAEQLEDIIQPTEVPNLEVVCAGVVPTNPSELCGSRRMSEFLKEVTKRYDRVILDCPPVTAVSDPLIIASQADGAVYVTKFNKIRREHARKSIQRVVDAGIEVLGVVLNDIDFEGRDSYYYAYYYYQNRYYASHYKQTSKAPSARPEPAPKA